MSISLRKTLLVVCEGESTEPNYFHDLKKIVDDKKINYRINIVPKPPLKTKEELQAKKEAAANSRPLRQIKTVPDEHLLPAVIPKEFQGQPTRYVWFALDGLDTHDEVWSVYDKDGHPHHEQAIQLAESMALEGKKVNIAFSSIAFELWYLLHFEEKPPYPFVKSQCRTDTKPDNCGKGIDKDCKGELCIAGYVKTQGYMSKEGKIKEFRYADIADRTEFAIENAINIRRELPKDTGPIYDLNPFTNVDKLVFKLLFIENDYKWVDFKTLKDQPIGLEILAKGNQLEILIRNNSANIFIWNSNRLKLVNVKGEVQEFLNRFHFSPHEERRFDLDLSKFDDFKPRYFSLLMDDGNTGIIEIP